jgi:hypothetical protein
MSAAASFPPRVSARIKALSRETLESIVAYAAKPSAYFSPEANRCLIAVSILHDVPIGSYAELEFGLTTRPEIGSICGLEDDPVSAALRELRDAGVASHKTKFVSTDPDSPHYESDARCDYTKLWVGLTGRSPHQYPKDALPDPPPPTTDKCPGCGHIGDMEITKRKRCRKCKVSFKPDEVERVRKERKPVHYLYSEPDADPEPEPEPAPGPEPEPEPAPDPEPEHEPEWVAPGPEPEPEPEPAVPEATDASPYEPGTFIYKRCVCGERRWRAGDDRVLRCRGCGRDFPYHTLDPP